MAPIEGVIQVQGDITNARTAEVVWTFLALLILEKEVQRQLPTVFQSLINDSNKVP